MIHFPLHVAPLTVLSRLIRVAGAGRELVVFCTRKSTIFYLQGIILLMLASLFDTLEILGVTFHARCLKRHVFSRLPQRVIDT